MFYHPKLCDKYKNGQECKRDCKFFHIKNGPINKQAGDDKKEAPKEVVVLKDAAKEDFPKAKELVPPEKAKETENIMDLLKKLTEKVENLSLENQQRKIWEQSFQQGIYFNQMQSQGFQNQGFQNQMGWNLSQTSSA